MVELFDERCVVRFVRTYNNAKLARGVTQNDRQYFAMVGSILSLQAAMPPVRLSTLVNPE
jgi:hypothetical protein